MKSTILIHITALFGLLLGGAAFSVGAIKVIVVPLRSGSQTVKHVLQDYGLKTFGMGDCLLRYACLRDLERGMVQPIPWRQALEGWDAAAGVPIAAHLDSTLEAFPDARVVLMIRPDADAHFRSWSNLNDLLEFIRSYLWFVPRLRQLGKSQKVMMNGNFFAGGKVDDPDYVKAVFANYTAKVKSLVPPERLLVLDVADKNGLGQLTNFLDVHPRLQGPLPRLNSAQNEVKFSILLALVVDLVVLALALLLYWKIGLVGVVVEVAVLYGLYQTWMF